MSWCDFAAGLVGGSSGLICGHPIDTVKTVQQARGDGMLAVARDILTREGGRGFFKGMLYPVLTAGAINSIFFGVYGNLLPLIQRDKQQDYAAIFVAATAGGAAQMVIAGPVELVKVSWNRLASLRKLC